MTNNYEIKNKRKHLLPDEMMEKVIGGMIPNIVQKKPEVFTSRISTYKSGATPKYYVGQMLEIKCTFRGDCHKVDCVVLEVSSKANAGFFFKEFSYTVEILSYLTEDFYGTIYTDVHESCLYPYE